tara:strand:- start:211 stop:450 length:240 start_codon:yes stop_codon:yes gene_type:complete
MSNSAKAPCVKSTVKSEELIKDRITKKNKPKYFAGILRLFKSMKYEATKKILINTPKLPKFIKPSETNPLLADMSGLLK